MLELSAVSKSFGSHQVLNQAWLQVRRAEVVGLVGANGAGKTTILRMAAGLIRPDQGSVRWETSPVRLHYFAGEATLPPHVTARRWASLFGVASDEKRRIGTLSRGTRQMLGLGIALHGPPPDLLLLDEPWDGLDPPAAHRLSDAIRDWSAAGSAILISSHRLHDLDDVAMRFVVLEHGRCRVLQEHGGAPGRVQRIADVVARGRSGEPPRLARGL